MDFGNTFALQNGSPISEDHVQAVEKTLAVQEERERERY